jgi:hypothetical protein
VRGAFAGPASRISHPSCVPLVRIATLEWIADVATFVVAVRGFAKSCNVQGGGERCRGDLGTPKAETERLPC